MLPEKVRKAYLILLSHPQQPIIMPVLHTNAVWRVKDVTNGSLDVVNAEKSDTPEMSTAAVEMKMTAREFYI